ncbi:MAG: hypothetical protein V3V99_12900 [candidate division Zixibacteria bacterium]
MSVGHIARAFEKAGIATVVIAIQAFCTTLEAMSLPRLVTTPHLLGRPLGLPHDEKRQLYILNEALNLIDTAGEGGTILEISKA